MTRALAAHDERSLFDVAADYRMPALSADEIIIDLFAGGGGASLGIEWGTGRSPDEAVNHSPAAIAIHALNHPTTRHHPIDIWKADPVEVAAGRPVGLLWLSPDCTHHSKAKGGRPVSKKLRCLAHVGVRYAKKVRPRIIALENVAEFLQWGPVSRATGRPDPKRKGHSFRGWKRQLERLGYVVEYRKLRGMFYGAPTTRERLFLIARCDGAPIRWPEPTHGPGLLPVHQAHECLDFSLPCPSIFLTPEEAKAEGKRLGRRIIRPLATATNRRMARGIYRFVLTGEPFIVGNVAPLLVPRYGEREGQEPRTRSVEQPFPTIVPTGNGAQLVAAFLSKNYSERNGNEVMASGLRSPIGTITGTDHHALVAVHIQRDFGQSVGHRADEPLATITPGGGGKCALVAAFLSVYYGNEDAGQPLNEPLRTITPHDRFALVVVKVEGVEYVMTDIAMRTLVARELARGQGFPNSYALDGVYIDEKGKTRRITETDQKEMVGNSVNPQIPAALCRANFGEPVVQHVDAGEQAA